MGAKPLVLQIPVGIESSLKGIVDLVKMKSVIWKDETLGAEFEHQDIPTNIATHLGLSSRFANRAHYSWQEAVIPQFNSWLVNRYEKQMEDK